METKQQQITTYRNDEREKRLKPLLREENKGKGKNVIDNMNL